MAGCGEDAPSAVARNLTRIEPAPGWRDVYGEVEACTGETGDFDRVRWFRAEEIEDREGEPTGGAWLVAQDLPHGIALLERLLERGSPQTIRSVVRHEAIHEILQLASHDGEVWCRCDDRPELFPQCG